MQNEAASKLLYTLSMSNGMCSEPQGKGSGLWKKACLMAKPTERRVQGFSQWMKPALTFRIGCLSCIATMVFKGLACSHAEMDVVRDKSL